MIRIFITLIFAQFLFASLASARDFKYIKFKAKGHSSLTNSFTQQQAIVSEHDDLMERIQNYFSENYQDFGDDQVRSWNEVNDSFDLGQENFSGFSWQKPIGNIGVKADRQLSPDISGSGKWIVQDTFKFHINAATYLSQLNDDNVLDMSESEIAAFAGINFIRTFVMYHYASSFKDGLTSDFRYLFMPYTFFSKDKILSLKSGEVLKRQDEWTIAAGGFISAIPANGVDLSAGIFFEKNKSTSTAIQHFPDQDNFLNITHSIKSKTSSEVQLDLQLDFYQLLNIRLFQYKLEFEKEEETEVALKFDQEDKNLLNQHNATTKELERIIENKPTKIQYLEPYVTSLDLSTAQSFASERTIFLKADLKKSKTEQIKVIKDGISQIFYKTYYESISFIENFWSRLFNGIIFRLFEIDTLVSNASYLSKKVNMEYKASLEQSHNPKKRTVQESEDFIFDLNFSFTAQKTHRYIDKYYKDQAISFVDQFTSLKPDFKTMLRQEELRGPLNIQTQLKLDFTNINFLNKLKLEKVASLTNESCVEQTKIIMKRVPNRKIPKRVRVSAQKDCSEELMKYYSSYRKVYDDLARHELSLLNKFILKLTKVSPRLSDLKNYFGEDVFLKGSFKSATKYNTEFMTYFTDGSLKDQGPITNFKMSPANLDRQPANE